MLRRGQEAASAIGGGELSSVARKPDQTVPSPAANFPSASAWKSFAIPSLLLVVITAALYGRVHQYEFVNYDDTLYVTQNTHVQAGLTWDTVRWAFTTYSVGTWHPVTWLSHALDCQLFDVDAAGPHDINLLLHAVNAVLLFWVLLRATGFIGRSFMVAAIFALHPINVESVVWIAERKNALSLLFFLLALGAYRWYVEKPKAGRYLTVALLFAIGLMSKPQVITFPFVLLLWDYWPLGRYSLFDWVPQVWRFPDLGTGGTVADTKVSNTARLGAPNRPHSEQRNSEEPRLAQKMGEPGAPATALSTAPATKFWRLVWEKLPLFALAGVSAAITMAAQRADGNKITYPWSLRIEYAIVSYVQYIGKALWPARLSPFYPHPDYVKLWQIVGAVLLLAAISLAVIAFRRSRPYLLVGWFFFLGTLVPMLGLAGVGYQGKQGIADRYAYLPFIGLFIMISWGVAGWAERKRVSPVLLRGVSIVALLALTIVSYRQIGYWRDNVTLWSHALEVTDGNFLAENNLGKALLAQGNVAQGITHFYRAAAIYPDDPVSNFNIGIYEQARGNYPAAIARYIKTLSITRDPELRAVALKNLADAYRQLGNAK